MARAKSRPTTDRERIAAAMAELVGRGYGTLSPFETCCARCGWREIARQTGAIDSLPEDIKTVWWDEIADTYAFVYDTDLVTSMVHHVHGASHGEDRGSRADSILERLTRFTTLLAPLFVHWRGDQNEIAAALRAQGLRVQVPMVISTCIAVLPDRIDFRVQPVNGEVLFELDGEEVQLTTADARRLVRKLNRAARLAEAQFPAL